MSLKTLLGRESILMYHVCLLPMVLLYNCGQDSRFEEGDIYEIVGNI
jgi:hypothetical protein